MAVASCIFLKERLVSKYSLNTSHICFIDMILICHLCKLNTKSVNKFRKYLLACRKSQADIKIALGGQKWPNNERHCWLYVKRQDGRFGVFFVILTF